MRFDGRVLLATGAGSGIAAATSRRFAAEGGRVAVLDLDADRAQTVAAELDASLGIECDVSDEQSVRKAVRSVAERLGRIDGVFNAAGHLVSSPIETHSATRVGPGDALACGLADAFVASAEFGPLIADLRRGYDVDRAIRAASARSGPAPSAPLVADRARIEACYASDGAEDIAERIAAAGWETAREALATASPTAIKVTLAALRRARELPSLRACLAAELRTSCAMLRIPDFAEGVRAMVVDKDRRPAWRPPAIADVHEDEIAAVLAGPDGLRDLWEPQREVPGATTAADTIYRVSPLDDPVPTETREFGFVDPDLREDPMARTRTHRTGRQPRLGP